MAVVTLLVVMVREAQGGEGANSRGRRTSSLQCLRLRPRARALPAATPILGVNK